MFGRRISLFKLAGFSVRMDISWLIIAVLVTWSLAVGVFPPLYQQLPVWAYWIMGVAGTAGLFLSIVIHEMCHSLVARQYGLPMKGITLFIFGGVAEMTEEPSTPKAEFLMAIAGPAASVAVAVVCYGVAILGAAFVWPSAFVGVFAWLGVINLVLVAFNMIPGFPLDGGRVLRAALWHWRGDIRWATRIAAKIGSGFGIFLIVLGVVYFLMGALIGGLWWFLIGLFIRSAATRSYEQLLVRQALEHEPIRRLMNDHPVSVPPTTTIQQLVDDYMLHYHFKSFPVVDGGRLIGCVNVPAVKAVPREQWPLKTVMEIVEPTCCTNAIAPHHDALTAMTLLTSQDRGRLMVVDEGQLIGIVSRKDVMKFLAMKMELQGESLGGLAATTRSPDDEDESLRPPRPPRAAA
jgi:Zn-dependent protease/predicted transcriptional regulator